MHEDYDPTLDEWVALLSISTRFGMEKIRQRAIYQIDDEEFEVDPIEKILLDAPIGKLCKIWNFCQLNHACIGLVDFTRCDRVNYFCIGEE